MVEQRLYHTLSRRERKELNKDNPDSHGGMHVDNRWAND